MSEEEQIERIKKNQERLTNKTKAPLSAPGDPTQSQTLEIHEEVWQIINHSNWFFVLSTKIIVYIFFSNDLSGYFFRLPSL